jgi:hypothetical protein
VKLIGIGLYTPAIQTKNLDKDSDVDCDGPDGPLMEDDLRSSLPTWHDFLLRAMHLHRIYGQMGILGL